jgi:hypothetical protein
MRIKLETIDPWAFVKRAYKLAYDACGGTSGYGIFQARDRVTEDDVFKNVSCAGDYPGGNRQAEERAKDGEFYGDYVFGRMVKLGMRIKDGVVEIRDYRWRPDYNAFVGKYPDGEALTKATLLSLGEREDSYGMVEEKETA